MHAFVCALVFLLSVWRNHVAMTIMAMTVAGGDSAYTDDVGGKLRCRIIIMPAFLHWQACRVKWQTLGKPEARIANRWQASVVAYKMHSCLYTFAGKQRPQVSAFIILN